MDTQQNHEVFQGISNFRDLGGYRNQQGRYLRKGKIYRSARLNALSADDLTVFNTLRISTICDFRGDEEYQEDYDQSGVIIDIQPHRLTIPPRIAEQVIELYHANDLNAETAHKLMMASYRSYVTDYVVIYRNLFDLLTDHGNHPLIFHCTAGKDRTGVAAALILSALNVDRDTIMNDYMLTNQLWNRAGVDRKGLPDDICEALLSARPDYLNAAFMEIEDQHGSVERFFEVGLGLDGERRRCLEELLLE